MACNGTLENHCCWIDGKVCKYFDPAIIENKRCSLRAKCSSWEEVYTLPEYIDDILPTMKRLAINSNKELILCGEFPGIGETCATCGCVDG